MLTIENDTVVVNKQSSKLVGFRLEDTVRAPVIIVFVDEEKPELLPLIQGQTPPAKVRIISRRGKHPVGDIGRAITREEIKAALADFP